MADQRALVRNAADPRQVKFAERVERAREERWLRALLNVMNSPDGRVVLAGLITRAGVHRSIWDQSARIHYNSGQQDYGHRLMADCVQADEDLFELMLREERQWNRQQQRSIDAAHTARGGQREVGRAETGDHDGED